ncbi:MAG: DUF2934 domain-containing protein [Solirubrobacterales bacterium]
MARKESRKTTGGGSKRGQTAKGAETREAPSRIEQALGTGSISQPQSNQDQESGGAATATLSISHEQIAERARQIWEQHGRPQGEDEKNWREAERQLKSEMGTD